MRQLTKAEACRELAVSLSTLDRRIASGDIQVRREQRGSRHRIYVMLDDDLAENGANARSQGTLLDVAQERIRGLDEQVALLQAQLANWSRSGTPGWRRSIGRSVSSATG